MITFLLATMIGQDQLPTIPISAEINQLAFFAGHWQGTRGDAWVEEWWSAPKDDILMGSFRMHSKGKLVFSESIRLSITEKTVEMGLKHFSPDFTGWEEKNETTKFALTAIKSNQAIFYHADEKGSSWLIYTRDGDEMIASLQRSANTPPESQLFKFHLVK
ncbi:MAG: hypothetical protein KF824_11405 [Fimbriimonadaceae bacterium]|nr:MAG: hypothetical protein KF824_11405 [Fimbriimonadaceae bacterium]